MHDASPAVLVWWAALSAVSLVNIFAWSRIVRAEARGVHKALCTIFVFGCAFRSFLPRTEAQRLVLVDSWISAAPIARIVATAAELAFAAQVALVLHAAAERAPSRAARRISLVLVPSIALAELFSWYSALTSNFLGSVLEEALWAVTFTLALIGFGLVRQHFSGAARLATAAAMVAAALYVGFMCTVDVPMYVRRWQRDEAAGRVYFTVQQGWADSWQRRVVTRRLEDWREEMPWMSLYFSCAVWLSVGMAWISQLDSGSPSS